MCSFAFLVVGTNIEVAELISVEHVMRLSPPWVGCLFRNKMHAAEMSCFKSVSCGWSHLPFSPQKWGSALPRVSAPKLREPPASISQMSSWLYQIINYQLD